MFPKLQKKAREVSIFCREVPLVIWGTLAVFLVALVVAVLARRPNAPGMTSEQITSTLLVVGSLFAMIVWYFFFKSDVPRAHRRRKKGNPRATPTQFFKWLKEVTIL